MSNEASRMGQNILFINHILQISMCLVVFDIYQLLNVLKSYRQLDSPNVA